MEYHSKYGTEIILRVHRRDIERARIEPAVNFASRTAPNKAQFDRWLAKGAVRVWLYESKVDGGRGGCVGRAGGAWRGGFGGGLGGGQALAGRDRAPAGRVAGAGRLGAAVGGATMIMSILGGGVLLPALCAAYILGREAGRQLTQDQDDPIDPADCIVHTPGGAQEESEVPNAQKIGHLTNRVDLIDLPNYEQKFTNVEGVIG